MFCPPEYPYQMATEYQDFESQQAYPGQTLQAYNTSVSAYSPLSTQDRPSPSFRIEDILLQNKVGVYAGLPYGAYSTAYYANYQNVAITHSYINDREIQGKV